MNKNEYFIFAIELQCHHKFRMVFVRIRVQNHILGLRLWPRTLISPRTNKQQWWCQVQSPTSNMQEERSRKVVWGGLSPRTNEAQIKCLFYRLKWPYRKRTWRIGTRKYLRKSCCHRIKCPAANFLATFMWRKPLNNAVLATATHRRPEGVSDRTSTRVAAWMIDKCRIMIIRRELYNVRDPPWIGDRGRRRKTL